MPRISNVLFSAESTSQEQDALLHLIRITIPTTGTLPEADLYLVDNNEAVTFQGIDYSAFPLQFTGINHTSDGSIDKAQLACANPERMLMPYIENYNYLKGTTVQVTTIYQSHLVSNPSGYITDYFVLDSYTASDTVLTLMLDPNLDFNRKLPKCTFNSNSCRFRYKDPVTCKYSGPMTYCQKTLVDCIAHTVPFFPQFDPISTTYAAGAYVTYNAKTYKCTATSSAPHTPDNTSYWVEETLIKNTDSNSNSIVWMTSGEAWPVDVTPGTQIVINGATYTIKSVNAKAKLKITGDVVGNVLIIGTSMAMLDGTSGISFTLQTGNQSNYGGFPGVPNTVRNFIL